MSETVEFGLMCPQCQALVGSGEHDRETFLDIERIAKMAGLTVLLMYCDERSTESCECEAPSPLTKFVHLMSIAQGFEIESKGKDGKWEKGVPDSLTPTVDLKGKNREESKQAIEQYVKDVQAKTGLTVATVEIIAESHPKLPRFALPKEKCEYAFSTPSLGAVFMVVSLREKWNLIHVRVIESAHGYQVWPAQPGDVFTTKATKLKRDEYLKDIVFPFVQGVSTVKQENYDKWIEKNLELKKVQV